MWIHNFVGSQMIKNVEFLKLVGNPSLPKTMFQVELEIKVRNKKVLVCYQKVTFCFQNSLSFFLKVGKNSGIKKIQSKKKQS